MSNRVLFLFLSVVVVSLLLLNQPSPSVTDDSNVSGTTLIWVTGRIVDAHSDAPISDAVVISRPAQEPVDMAAWEAQRRRWNARRTDTPTPWPSDITSADGSFALSLAIDWSYTQVDGVIRRGTNGPPPRQGVRAVRVAAPGREAQTLPIGGGTGDWLEGEGRTRWDLGTLRIN